MDFASKYDTPQNPNNYSEQNIKDALNSLKIGPIKNIQRLSGGFRNINIKVTTHTNELFVLKISGNSQHQFETEIAILNAMKGKVPVPEVIAHQLNNKELKII